LTLGCENILWSILFCHSSGCALIHIFVHIVVSVHEQTYQKIKCKFFYPFDIAPSYVVASRLLLYLLHDRTSWPPLIGGLTEKTHSFEIIFKKGLEEILLKHVTKFNCTSPFWVIIFKVEITLHHLHFEHKH
jgi:hypothetical protein